MKIDMSLIIPVLKASTTWLGSFVVVLLSIIAPITPLLYVMLFLIIVDNITGIAASFTEDGVKFRLFSRTSWRHIKSAKLGKTLGKMLLYFLLIISGFVIDEFIICATVDYITKAVVAAMAFRELISIIENVELTTGTNLLGLIKSILKHGLRRGLTYNNDNQNDDMDEDDGSL